MLQTGFAILMGEMSTELQTWYYNSEETTMSVFRRRGGSAAPDHLMPYKIAIVVVSFLGAVMNTLVLLGFCLAGRSKMTSCSNAYIANHTTLERPISSLCVLS